MPEDDRRPVPVHLFDLRVADVRSGCVRLKADGCAAVPHEGLNEGPVAGSHVENRARRQDLEQAIGKRLSTLSCSSRGQGDVVATPQRAHRTRCGAAGAPHPAATV